MVSLGFAGRQARGTVSAGGPLIKAKGHWLRPERRQRPTSSVRGDAPLTTGATFARVDADR